MLEAIRSADDHVFLETYIFSDDEVGREFASLLKDKSRDGVTVGIIYDSVGSIRSDGSFFDDMKNAGIRLIQFNGVNPVAGGNLLKLNNRSHRKLLIVDGRIAFTGGINLSKTYSSSSAPVPGKTRSRRMAGHADRRNGTGCRGISA